jgi:hypothetical protein
MLGGIRVCDKDGRWWGPMRKVGAPDTFFIVRLDKDDKTTLYPCPQGIGGGNMPQVQISPAGNVWAWTEKEDLRYDAATDKFVAAEPWEEFSFKFGPWQLSLAGKVSGNVQGIYRKDDGAWRQLTHPFGKGQALGNPDMIRGDRMLLSVGFMGVLEYDAAADRWALLHENANVRAFFDPTGRRVLLQNTYALIYDGDPMAPIAPADQKEAAVFNELLKLMDNSSWKVREKATEDIKKLYPSMPARFKAAAADPRFSLEVRTRIELILEKMVVEKTEAVPLESLFRRMHPVIRPAATGAR